MLDTFLSGRARLVTHLVGWAVVALLFLSVLGSLRGPEEALARTGVNLVFLATIFYGNAKILVNRFLEKGRYVQMVAYGLLLVLTMAGLRTWVELQWFGGSIFEGTALPLVPRRVFATFAISFFLLLFFSTLYQLVENRHQLELQHRELETRHTEAQLNYLKAQINPHFLFNTLNNIYAAATLGHPNTAAMVLRLSDLLRYVTYDGQAARVPLEKELDQIRAYLELFRMKSDQPLYIEISFDGLNHPRPLEPMLLLPVVENALKHGNLGEAEGSFLRLALNNEPGHLSFRAENSFDPENRQKDAQGGVGLANIRRRLELNYPGRHRFEARPEGNVFVVQLEIEDHQP